MSIFKFDIIHKVSISAIFIVLIIIFTRVLAIGNIEPIPFLRISIGPALIIISSLVLGPVYGGIVGALSDVLGILMFPNAYSINLLFTLVYALFGIFPAILNYFIRKIRNEKLIFSLNCVVLGAIFLFILIFLILNSEFELFGHSYNFDLTQRILIIVASFVALALIIVAIFFINKHFKKMNKYNVSIYRLSAVIIVNNVLWMLILNTIIKAWFFEIDFLIILFSQAITFMFDVLIASYLVPYLLLLLAKIFKSQIIEL